jgi:hypothetical protein
MVSVWGIQHEARGVFEQKAADHDIAFFSFVEGIL